MATTDRIFRIKKWITLFFACAIMAQACFVCYASNLPANGDLALQILHVERLGKMLIAGITLNLLVAIVALFGFNVSIVNSFKCK